MRIILLVLVVFINGCSNGEHLAPVADLSNSYQQKPQSPGVRPPQSERPAPLIMASAQMKTPPSQMVMPKPFSAAKWQWPTQGRIIKAYSSASKGIDITNRIGEPIYAAGDGKVVYSGNGIRGYGNLIIIKHQHAYMTAYAHHSRVYVKAGQRVVKGQKIAEMGKSGSTKVKLYFQVRHRGRPINPNTLF